MLDTFRKRKDNIVYTFLILLVVLVMGFYGVDQFRNKDGVSNSGPAAYVNGEMISQLEFRQELGARLQQYESMLGGQYNEQLLSALRIPERTLDELVQMKLLSQQAKQLGVVVSDAELAHYIRKLPYYQKDGKFDAETYAKIPDRGLAEKQMRERLQLAKFQTYLTGRVKLTPRDISEHARLRDTKLNLEIAKIDFNALGKDQKPTAAQLETYLKTAPEADLKAHYDKHIKTFTRAATVTLSQIRVGVPFKASDAQKTEAKKKIDEIAKTVTTQNFADTARAKSDDEYAKKGGLVGQIDRGTLEEPLERALDTLEVGKVSSPVETSFGYFLLYAKEKNPESVQPFEVVKRRVAEMLLAETEQKQFADTTKRRWEESLAAGKSIEAELKKFKVEAKKTGPFAADSGYIPTLGQADAILDAVFELSLAAPLAKQLFFHQDSYYYVKLAGIEKAKAPTAAADQQKEREVVEKALTTSLQNEIMTQWISGLEKTATVKKEVDFGAAKGTEAMGG